MSQDELRLQLENITLEMKKLVRRQDEMQKDLSLLNDDRQILEDLVASVAHLKSLTISGGNKTKVQIEQVKDKVEEQAAVVRYSLVDELKSKFRRKNIEPKVALWRRLFKRG